MLSGCMINNENKTTAVTNLKIPGSSDSRTPILKIKTISLIANRDEFIATDKTMITAIDKYDSANCQIAHVALLLVKKSKLTLSN
jgi:hypothetical protein